MKEMEEKKKAIKAIEMGHFYVRWAIFRGTLSS